MAGALEIPKGTVGHHCKTLEAAGLIRVVRTRRVRALEEKFYGRTARVFVFGRPDSGPAKRPAGLIHHKLHDESVFVAAVEAGDERTRISIAGEGRLQPFVVSRLRPYHPTIGVPRRPFDGHPFAAW